MSAVISGGSLSGLMIGIVLRDLGWRVDILERAPTVESQGAGIVLGRFSKAYFKAFDFTHTDVGVPALQRRFLFKDGSEMASEPLDLLMTSWDKLYYVLRANFDGFEKPGYLDMPVPRDRPTGNCSYSMGSTVIAHTYNNDNKRVTVQYSQQGTNKFIETDLLICAEGASSNIRQELCPTVERKYSGYLAFRGLIPEKQLSQETLEELLNKMTFVHSTYTQFLIYAIPGSDGSAAPGSRNLNFVWYNNFAEGTDDLEKVMTDKDGVRRTNSISTGRVPQMVIDEEILPRGRAFLPPGCLECLEKTNAPFIQLVTDVIASQNTFYEGHLLLVGDALCGVRPHTTASTNQAAEHALTLYETLRENPFDLSVLSTKWQPGRIEYAKHLYDIGAKIGNLSQFHVHPMTVEIDKPGAERELDPILRVGEPK